VRWTCVTVGDAVLPLRAVARPIANAAMVSAMTNTTAAITRHTPAVTPSSDVGGFKAVDAVPMTKSLRPFTPAAVIPD
jgi:hypothetical protein